MTSDEEEAELATALEEDGMSAGAADLLAGITSLAKDLAHAVEDIAARISGLEDAFVALVGHVQRSEDTEEPREGDEWKSGL